MMCDGCDGIRLTLCRCVNRFSSSSSRLAGHSSSSLLHLSGNAVQITSALLGQHTSATIKLEKSKCKKIRINKWKFVVVVVVVVLDCLQWIVLLDELDVLQSLERLAEDVRGGARKVARLDTVSLVGYTRRLVRWIIWECAAIVVVVVFLLKWTRIPP